MRAPLYISTHTDATVQYGTTKEKCEIQLKNKTYSFRSVFTFNVLITFNVTYYVDPQSQRVRPAARTT